MTNKTRHLLTLLIVALILLIATALRWAHTGLGPLSTDGATHTLLAYRIARDGVFTLDGPPMSVGRSHSPFAIYVYALPYTITPDPRIAGMFTGLLNVIGVALLYAVGRRYFGVRAALIAALLYAIHPEAITSSIGIWNPRLGAPLVMAWLYTGLLGYHDDNRLMRWIHLGLLGLAMQTHPMLVLLAPISLSMWIVAVIRRPGRWPAYLLDGFGSLLIALAVLLPWLLNIGALNLLSGGGSDLSVGQNRGLGYIIETMAATLGTYHYTPLRLLPAAIFFVGATWLLARAGHRESGLPGIVITATFFAVPLLALLIDFPYRSYHMMAAAPAAYLVDGALMGGVKGRRPVPYWLGAVLTGAIIATLLPLHTLSWKLQTTSGPDFDAQIALMVEQFEAGHEVIALTSADSDYRQWAVLQRVMAEQHGLDLRVVWEGQGLPLPENGATTVTSGGYPSFADLLRDAEMPSRGLLLTDLPPASAFTPSIPLVEPVTFSNGAAITGLIGGSELPRPGEDWSVRLMAVYDAAPDPDTKLYLHLVDEAGTRYGQCDFTAAPGGGWRAGEPVLYTCNLTHDRNLPLDRVFGLRFGYSIPGQPGAVAVTGGFANAQGDAGWRPWHVPVMVPLIDGLAVGLDADSITLEQGPPLGINTTWLYHGDITEDLLARWRLLDQGGQIAYEDIHPIVDGLPLSAWSDGAMGVTTTWLRIPTDIEPGEYVLALDMADEAGQPHGNVAQLPVTITERPRSFEMPTPTLILSTPFQQASITLLGADTAQDGDQLYVTLYWLAEDMIDADYTYFVHVLDAAGSVAAQVDAVPLNYGYPTSWWAPNEVIANPLTLDLGTLPAGTYVVRTGFYDPATGERLSVGDGDSVLLINLSR